MDTKQSRNIKDIFMNNAIYFVLLTLIIVIAIGEPAFLSIIVLRDILLQTSTRIIIALGMGLILISGGVDLSCGRVVGLSVVIAASLSQKVEYASKFFPNLPELPIIAPLVACLIMGVIVGAINGVFVTVVKVPPFIATLSTQLIVYGLALMYFDLPPNSSQPIGGLRSDFTFLGSGYISFIPTIVVIVMIVISVMFVVYKYTDFGKNVYAIGGNRNAAEVAGVNVRRGLITTYALGGSLFALAGLLESARTGGGSANYGTMYEFDAIAACVVGGVSTTGGVGKIFNIVVGVLIFGVINYGLTFIGVSPYWQLVVKGLIIVAAVGLDIRKYLAKK